MSCIFAITGTLGAIFSIHGDAIGGVCSSAQYRIVCIYHISGDPERPSDAILSKKGTRLERCVCAVVMLHGNGFWRTRDSLKGCVT